MKLIISKFNNHLKNFQRKTQIYNLKKISNTPKKQNLQKDYFTIKKKIKI